MADKKISQLPLASTPLAGGETLPIVQTGATVQVSVNNLTAGRGISATSVTNGLGATGTPSYTFTGDTNTGMWSPAADTIAFSEGGVERMRLDASGNVLVGKDSSDPAIVGHVLGSAGNLVTTRDANVCHTLNRNTSDGAIVAYRRDNVAVATIIATTTAVTYNTSATSGLSGIDANTVAIRTNSAERMRVDSAGNVGIGVTNPSGLLDVNGIIVGRSSLSLNDAINYNGSSAFFIRSRFNGGTVQIGTETTAGTLYYPITINGTSDFMSFSNQAGEVMRVAASGNVGVNEVAPDYRLDVNGTFGFTPGASVTPVDNGDVVFELTNNTTLTVKARGSDGVVRSATLTLA
jgi:hypothetical protein